MECAKFDPAPCIPTQEHSTRLVFGCISCDNLNYYLIHYLALYMLTPFIYKKRKQKKNTIDEREGNTKNLHVKQNKYNT